MMVWGKKNANGLEREGRKQRKTFPVEVMKKDQHFHERGLGRKATVYFYSAYENIHWKTHI